MTRYQIRSGNNFDFSVGGDPSYATFDDIDSAEESLAHLNEQYPGTEFRIHMTSESDQDQRIDGKYLLRILNAAGGDDALPAGIDYDAQDGFTFDGEPIDPNAEYRAWNCANPNAVFSDESCLSDWSIGPA